MCVRALGKPKGDANGDDSHSGARGGFRTDGQIRNQSGGRGPQELQKWQPSACVLSPVPIPPRAHTFLVDNIMSLRTNPPRRV